MATYYWVGGSGTWDNSSKTNWATTSGGAGGSGPPTSADNVNFDTNSGTSATVTVASTAAGSAVTVNKSDITLTLSGNVTFVGALTLTTGAINLSNNILTVLAVSSDNSNSRSINFGTGTIKLTRTSSNAWNSSTATNFSYSGTPTVNLDATGGASIRYVYFGNVAGATETNALNFNVVNGTDTVSFAGRIKSLDLTGFSGSFTNAAITIYRNLTISSGTTINAATYNLTFAGTSGTQLVTSNGKTFDFQVVVNAPGATVRHEDNFTVGSTRTFVLTSGTWGINGKAISLNTYSSGGSTSTREISFGGGTITVAGSGSTAWNETGSGLTTSGSGTINMTSASAKTFVGNGSTYSAGIKQGGAGNLTITGSNTFADFQNDNSAAVTVILTAGTTNTFTSFSLAGASGNLVTLKSSSAGNAATVSKTSGVVNVSYCSIQDISAVGGANWSSLTSNGNVDAGGNTGWIFALGKTWIVKARRRAIR